MSTYFCRNRKECLSVFRNALEGMKREYPNMPWETFRKHAHWCIEENAPNQFHPESVQNDGQHGNCPENDACALF